MSIEHSEKDPVEVRADELLRTTAGHITRDELIAELRQKPEEAESEPSNVTELE